MGLADLIPDYNSLYRVQAPSSNPYLTGMQTDATKTDDSKPAPDKKSPEQQSEQASGAAGNTASHLNFAKPNSGPTDGQVFGTANDPEVAAVMSDKNMKLDIKGVKPEHIAMAIEKFTKPKTNSSIAKEGLSNKMKALGH